MIESLRILLVEDSPTDAKLVMHALRRANPSIEFVRVQDEEALRSALATRSFDAIVCDWSLPRFSARQALAALRETDLDLPFIIVSGTIGEENAVDAMRAGAHDYVLKDKLARLAPAIEREIRDCKEREVHRRREARFRALIEKSTEGVFIKPIEGPPTYISPGVLAIFGVPFEELHRESFLDLVHPDDRAAVADAIARVRSTSGLTIHGEYRVLRRDGAVRWIDATSTNLVDDPAIAGVVTNMRDVTDRKEAADALRVSEARFARLAESGIIGILTADMGGALVEANDAYLKTMGYERQELIGGKIRWGDLIAPTNADSVAKFMELLLRQGWAPASEMEAVAKDGHVVSLLVGAAMLDATTCIAFSADLTEKKRIEDALHKSEEHLRQAQKMEAVGRLAGGVAHDFNNVLSVILSYSDLLCAELRPEDPMRDDLQQILSAGKRAANLTRQLLMFSRQQVLAPQILDLNELLAGLDKMLPRLLGEDIEIASFRENALGAIEADPSSIEQVIMNLVVNARDAMPTGGKLTIQTANVVLDGADALRLGTKSGGPHVELSVSDTGVGMDAVTMQHIFEPFYTTKSKDKGTGLGLSTVFGIASQSGGAVSVNSEVNRGTTFRVYLPCVERRASRSYASDEKPATGGKETILLVEDEAQVRAVAHGILRRNGYEVLEARDAKEAVLLCEEHPGNIHLLLSDVVMPNMSGPELATRLRPLRPQMKILFMSGYTDDSRVRHGIQNADVAFLQKPLTPALLARKVRSVLDAV